MKKDYRATGKEKFLNKIELEIFFFLLGEKKKEKKRRFFGGGKFPKKTKTFLSLVGGKSENLKTI